MEREKLIFMSSDDKKFIESLFNKLDKRITDVRDEIKDVRDELGARIDATNVRIDKYHRNKRSGKPRKPAWLPRME